MILPTDQLIVYNQIILIHVPNKTDSIKHWVTTFVHNTIQKEKAAKSHTAQTLASSRFI